MSFLGPVGSLIPVKCASQLTSSGGRSVSFQDTLGKRKAFLGNVRAREWSVDIGLAKPAELSGLRWLSENVNTPMVWYGPDAVVGNILSPAQADFAPGTHNGLEGPLVEVEPGVYVKSVLPDSGTSVAFPRSNGQRARVPVVVGREVTAAAWVRGANARVQVVWWNADQQNVGSMSSPVSSGANFRRAHVSGVPPAGAVALTCALYGSQVAGPSVTVSDRLLPYSPGRGATNVIVHGLSDAVIRATDQQQLGSLSFTISEVG